MAYWKIPHLQKGTLFGNGPFSFAMLVCQRVKSCFSFSFEKGGEGGLGQGGLKLLRLICLPLKDGLAKKLLESLIIDDELKMTLSVRR